MSADETRNGRSSLHHKIVHTGHRHGLQLYAIVGIPILRRHVQTILIPAEQLPLRVESHWNGRPILNDKLRRPEPLRHLPGGNAVNPRWWTGRLFTPVFDCLIHRDVPSSKIPHGIRQTSRRSVRDGHFPGSENLSKPFIHRLPREEEKIVTPIRPHPLNNLHEISHMQT
jgi:hypothetical protein